MEIVLSTMELGATGGAATYLVTVSEQLQRLGHEVTVYAHEVGPLAEEAGGRGLRVVSNEGDLPERCDVVYAQDGATAYLLADRYPGVPVAVCMHAGGASYARWDPPQFPGVAGAVVVLHEVMQRRAQAFAADTEVVRLRQPVDVARFAPRAPVSDPPRRALLLGNYMHGDRGLLVRQACAEASLEPVQVGLYGPDATLHPEVAINDSDLVIGQGRAIVEGMACGRPSFVYDQGGGDGWVTASSYDRLEARNFAGASSGEQMVATDLAARLREADRAMGPVNRDLARLHHAAHTHVEQLVDLFRRLAPSAPPPDAPLRELARMVRLQWQTETRVAARDHELRLLSARLHRAEALSATRRYRFAAALARPLDRLRRGR